MNTLKFYLKEEKGSKYTLIPEDVMDNFAIINLKLIDYDKDLPLKTKQKLIDRAIYNKVDKDFRNNLRQVRKHEIVLTDNDGALEVLDTMPNTIGIHNHIIDTEEVVVNKQKDEYYKKKIREIVKKDKLYDAFVAVVFDGYSVKEYANQCGIERTTMEHRYLKALRLIREDKAFVNELKNIKNNIFH